MVSLITATITAAQTQALMPQTLGLAIRQAVGYLAFHIFGVKRVIWMTQLKVLMIYMVLLLATLMTTLTLPLLAKAKTLMILTIILMNLTSPGLII